MNRYYDIIVRISTLYTAANNVLLQAGYNVVILCGRAIHDWQSLIWLKMPVFTSFCGTVRGSREPGGTLYETAYNVRVSNPPHPIKCHITGGL